MDESGIERDGAGGSGRVGEDIVELEDQIKIFDPVIIGRPHQPGIDHREDDVAEVAGGVNAPFVEHGLGERGRTSRCVGCGRGRIMHPISPERRKGQGKGVVFPNELCGIPSGIGFRAYRSSEWGAD